MSDYRETIHDGYAQTFAVDEVYYHQTTGQQDLKIFHNHQFGRVMALDGVIQTTQKDEFIYHEMLAHVPIFSHGNVRRVLIIGGGDGGMLREVLRHKNIDKVVQVEIDRAVIDMCTKYLPQHSAGAFSDPRFELVIDDGLRYVQQCEQTFDVIISDSTDPIGPGEALFTESFYAHCKRCLAEDGVLVTQNGVAFFQLEEAQSTARCFKNLFQHWSFYQAAVPTYVGGAMMFGFACHGRDLRQVDLATLQQRFEDAAIDTRYYDPEIHVASFALPRYVKQVIA